MGRTLNRFREPTVSAAIRQDNDQKGLSSDGHDAVQLVAMYPWAYEALNGGDYHFFEDVDERLRRPMHQPAFNMDDKDLPQTAYVHSDLLWEKLDYFQKELKHGEHSLKMTAGGAAVASMAVTVGYVLWTLKGGYLMASLMSQLPAWRFVDPLPIFDGVMVESTKESDEQDAEDGF